MRAAALLAPPVLALLLLAAHFYRAGLVVPATASLVLVALLFIRGRWASLALQVALVLGTLEWLRTAWALASHRAALGQPYGRLLVILGIVAVLTAAAALAVRARRPPGH
ncbi:MAG: hypothetical protein WBO04_10315 [Steroidobacteraceae bacterium]